MKKYMGKDSLPMTLNADDIQNILGVSRAGAYQLMHSEGFPLIKIGKRMLCMREDFFEWLDSKTERGSFVGSCMKGG